MSLTHFTVTVSNRIAKTFRRLPPSPYYPKNPTRSSTVSPVINMVVNNITQEFLIFLMPCVVDEIDEKGTSVIKTDPEQTPTHTEREREPRRQTISTRKLILRGKQLNKTLMVALSYGRN